MTNSASPRPPVTSVRRIAVEEAFCTPAVYEACKRLLGTPNLPSALQKMLATVYGDSPGAASLKRQLFDLDEGRLSHMAQAGIDVQVVSMTSPGVQALPADEGAALAAEANDVLAAAVRRHPGKLYGLTAVAPHSPGAGAREIERGKEALGMRGVIINSHTHGTYLDDVRFLPLLEAAEALSQPIYLHPREPAPAMEGPYLQYGLYFAGWGFAAETGLHAMRIIMSGLLDRYPRLKFVLGHLGEGIPYWLERIDNRYELQVKIGGVEPLKRRPSDYFRENFVVTTSGMNYHTPLRLCLDALGADRVLFAADHPYESSEEAVNFYQPDAGLDEATVAKIMHRNAEQLFQIDPLAGTKD
jgi:5-carboxyvanillate decarboxylase